MTTSHMLLLWGALGTVTLTGARVLGDMRELLLSQVGELSPPGPGVPTSALLETRLPVHSPVPHRESPVSPSHLLAGVLRLQTGALMPTYVGSGELDSSPLFTP